MLAPFKRCVWAKGSTCALCHHVDWLEVQRKGYNKTSVMGELLLLLLLFILFFLYASKMSANVTFLNFWTWILQTECAPVNLGRLFCLTYEAKLTVATALHSINVTDSRDMLPVIGCWSVTTVWNNDICFKEIKKHCRRWTDIDSFSFRYVLIDEAFSSSCMLSM